jgi:hypothetical protein
LQKIDRKNERRSIQNRKNLYLEHILLLIARLISPIDDINRSGYVGTTLDAFKYDPQDCEDQPSHKVPDWLQWQATYPHFKTFLSAKMICFTFVPCSSLKDLQMD